MSQLRLIQTQTWEPNISCDLLASRTQAGYRDPPHHSSAVPTTPQPPSPLPTHSSPLRVQPTPSSAHTHGHAPESTALET